MIKQKNRLQYELSPYLLQHSENPVDWFPWCEEAFEKAVKEDKPVLLSVGYSACHWCHVMESESFENEDIASFMNENFINIKVDREERPDIDNVYMNFVNSTTGRGGWPMTVFLLPDKTPFFGGTYFPPDDRYNIPSFPTVLKGISEAYHDSKAEIVRKVSGLKDSLGSGIQFNKKTELIPAMIDTALINIKKSFDKRNGGFGTAPKFPMAMALEFLADKLNYDYDPEVNKFLELTLKKMALGGMYDQIEGGFHRYSTDNNWLVPHFEKMLYDNSLLSIVYAKYFSLSGDKFYKEKSEETLNFVLDKMSNGEGGYYSTIDADSEDGEGDYYTLTLRELADIENKNNFVKYFNMTDRGNFEGKNILNAAETLNEFASKNNLTVNDLKNIREIINKIKEIRCKKAHPAIDDKIMTDWNSLFISALVRGYKVSGNSKYKTEALRSADFILSNLFVNDKLYHIYKNGKVSVGAFLEDYANFAYALIDIYEISFNEKYLLKAKELTEKMLSLFRDDSDGLFFLSESGNPDFEFKIKDIYDNATPSGNSTATVVFYKLGRIFGDENYIKISKNIFERLTEYLMSYPTGFGRYLSGALLHSFPPSECIMTGEIKDSELVKWLVKINKTLKPGSLILKNSQYLIAKNNKLKLYNPDSADFHLFICENYKCNLPIKNIEELNK